MEMNEKQQEILKAAAECFARYGYEKTTLDDIGTLVGLNKASLYYYYKNKESIFTEVISAEWVSFFKILTAKIKKTEGYSEKILAYISERFKHLEKTMNLHQLSFASIKSHSFFKGLKETFFNEEVKIINEILEDCKKHGEIISCDTKLVSRSILTVVDAIKTKAIQSSENSLTNKIDYSLIEDEVQFTITLILNGISNA